MKLHPRVTRSAVELVKRFEGLRRGAAQLADGGWTVGYGHTRSAREGAIVTAEDAEALLYYDLSEVAYKIDAWSFTPLNQNQFEALTAFAFNIGVENFRRSTVLKRVNEGNHLLAAAALELWRKAELDGETLVVDALVRRRAAEKAHYLTPPEGFRPSPSPVLRPTFDYSVIEAAANYRSGRAAAVVQAPLEGGQATALMESRNQVDATVPGAADAAFPSAPTPEEAAPPVAAALSTARLLQLFPEKFAERMGNTVLAPSPFEAPLEPLAPAPFTLQDGAEPASAPEPVNDGGPITAYSPDADQGSTLEAPPPPSAAMAAPEPIIPEPAKPDPGRFAVGFGGFTPPPVRRLETPPPFPSVGERARVGSVTTDGEAVSLFDTPSVRQPLSAAEGFRPDPVAGDPFAPPSPAPQPTLEAPTAKTRRLPSRGTIYLGVGVLGAALFAAALLSIFTGKASPLNLIIGLMGILLMVPAGGYFLLRFLNRRDGLADLDAL